MTTNGSRAWDGTSDPTSKTQRCVHPADGLIHKVLQTVTPVQRRGRDTLSFSPPGPGPQDPGISCGLRHRPCRVEAPLPPAPGPPPRAASYSWGSGTTSSGPSHCVRPMTPAPRAQNKNSKSHSSRWSLEHSRGCALCPTCPLNPLNSRRSIPSVQGDRGDNLRYGTPGKTSPVRKTHTC